jgi:hypothetical protein
MNQNEYNILACFEVKKKEENLIKYYEIKSVLFVLYQSKNKYIFIKVE